MKNKTKKTGIFNFSSRLLNGWKVRGAGAHAKRLFIIMALAGLAGGCCVKAGIDSSQSELRPRPTSSAQHAPVISNPSVEGDYMSEDLRLCFDVSDADGDLSGWFSIGIADFSYDPDSKAWWWAGSKINALSGAGRYCWGFDEPGYRDLDALCDALEEVEVRSFAKFMVQDSKANHSEIVEFPYQIQCRECTAAPIIREFKADQVIVSFKDSKVTFTIKVETSCVPLTITLRPVGGDPSRKMEKTYDDKGLHTWKPEYDYRDYLDIHCPVVPDDLEPTVVVTAGGHNVYSPPLKLVPDCNRL